MHRRRWALHNKDTIMDLYNKQKLRIGGIIAWLSFLVGVPGYLFTKNDLFLNLFSIIMGVNFVVFSHDLAMQQVVRYKFNYKFVRGVYLSGGVLFILAAIQSWASW